MLRPLPRRRARADGRGADALALLGVRGGDTDYLLRTWHPDTRPEGLELEPGQKWLRLEVLSWTGGGVLDAEGEVEFRAHYRWSGGREELHERSAFRRVDGAWAYVEALG